MARAAARSQTRVDGGNAIHTHVRVAGRDLFADPSGALYDEGEGALLVADLHFEKGSSFARRGMMLPPYDTAATLARLAAVIARCAPKLVIALGDSFHDGDASARLSDRDRDGIAALQSGRDWLWITGNHDPDPPCGVSGQALAEWRMGPLILRHEPLAGERPGEVAGHLHPMAIVLGTSGATRRRCFVSDGSRCVMPAFGAYAGGLNIHHHAFGGLFRAGRRMAHALGRDRVYPVHESRCLPGL